MNNSVEQPAASESDTVQLQSKVKSGGLRRWGRSILAGAAFLAASVTAEAGAIRPGFNATTLAANDDASTGLVNIGFSINFLGATYARLYVNNNGNLTFDRALSTFTPAPIASAGMRIIAPFWADVDTRGVGSEPVRYAFGAGSVNGRNAFGATYVNVGYYNAKADKLNSFQIVLVDRSDIGAGDFDMEFNYDKVQWETGNSSGGSGGVGGNSARVGFANGAAASLELAGSGTNGAFLDSNPQTGLIYNSLNAGGVAGRYIFQVRGGAVVNAPPSANAGADIVAAANQVVTLNGTASYDPEGLPLLYTWTQIGGAAVTLSNPLSPVATFTAPAGTYTFQLSASDGMSSATDTIVVTAGIPAATTRTATSVTHNSAILQGVVNPAGVSTQYHFEYSTSGGAIFSTPTQTVASGSSDVPVSSSITGLIGSTTYTFRVVASNTYGNATGGALPFTTSSTPVIPPTVSITSPTNGASFAENTVVNIAATAADSDGTVVRVEFFDGSVRIGEDTTAPFTQTLNGLAVGDHIITARATDNVGATALSAPVTIRVTSLNAAPVARADSGMTSEDVALNNINVLGNDTDANNDVLTVTAASSPNGTVTINANGTLNFAPSANFNGATTISYTISDGNGGTATAVVNVTVNAVNDAPVAGSNSVTTTEDTAANNINVLGNARDADGDVLTVTAASSPNGTVTINANGTLNFAPSANFNGATTISYTISDGNGGTATAVVNVTVNAVNDAPVAGSNSVTTTEDTAANNINVLGNAQDADGDVLTVTAASSPNGTVTINADGTLNFNPANGFTGPTTISYTISDGNGGTTTAIVAVTVTPVPHPPVANDDLQVLPNTPAPYVFAVLGNDTDVDGDALSIIATTNGAQGAVSTDGTNVIYAPAAGSSGVGDRFTYTISDGRGGTAVATVRIISSQPVVTLAPTAITPSSAMLNGRVNPNGFSTSLAFEYSTDPAFGTSMTTTSIPMGSGGTVLESGVPVTGLSPNTPYYFRAVATSEAGVFRGAIVSFRTPIISWGPSGAPSVEGLLDATRIPNSGAATRFTNISGLGYDVVMTTAFLGRNGHTTVTGKSSWWFEGSAPSASEPSTVRLRFYETGSTIPHGISGVRFQIDDAEQTETLLNFHYFTATGEKVYVPWNSPIFTYSDTPTYGDNFTTVENGAVYQGLTQSGKWVDVNLSSLNVSGFEFQLKRRTGTAGSVIMSSITTERDLFNIGGIFTPYVLETGADGFATLPDYTANAVVTGNSAGVILSQTPASGTRVAAGLAEVRVRGVDANGNWASAGFNISVKDKTAPVATVAPNAPLTLTAPAPLPNYGSFVTFQDNVGVTRIVQSPAARTATLAGPAVVTLTAYDAAGNVRSVTFDVSVNSSPDDAAANNANIASKGSVVPGSGTAGIPVGAVFKSFGVPSINDQRSVAFGGAWVRGSQKGTTIFAGNPPVPVATSGQASPGLGGAKFVKFLDPVLNASGSQVAVAFVADVAGAGIATANNTGVWTNLGGTIQWLAREGSVAPGTSEMFKSFTSISMVGDEVLIVASLTGVGATSANDVGVWRWTTATGLQLVLREGQHVLDGKTVASFEMLGSVSASSGHGRHHLDAGYYAARISCTDGSNAAVFIDFTGSEPVVFPSAQSRQAIVGGVLASSVGVPSGNPFGSSAFVTSLSGGSAIILSRQTIGGPAENRVISRRGEIAVNEAKWSSFRDPVMNGEDSIAWLGKLSGATTATDDVLAYCAVDGSPAVIAREGSAAPGTSAVFSSFKSVALPDGTNGPVFTASLLAGVGGVTSANDIGLWCTNSTGEVALMVREGDTIGGRVVTNFAAIDYVLGSPGQARSFNGQRDIIVLLTFADGGQSLTRLSVP